MNILLNLKCFVIFAEDWLRLGNMRLRFIALCLRNLCRRLASPRQYEASLHCALLAQSLQKIGIASAIEASLHCALLAQSNYGKRLR